MLIVGVIVVFVLVIGLALRIAKEKYKEEPQPLNTIPEDSRVTRVAPILGASKFYVDTRSEGRRIIDVYHLSYLPLTLRTLVLPASVFDMSDEEIQGLLPKWRNRVDNRAFRYRNVNKLPVQDPATVGHYKSVLTRDMTVKSVH